MAVIVRNSDGKATRIHVAPDEHDEYDKGLKSKEFVNKVIRTTIREETEALEHFLTGR